MKKKKKKSNRKITETGKTNMSNPQIHDPSLSWLDAGRAKSFYTPSLLRTKTKQKLTNIVYCIAKYIFVLIKQK